MAKVDVGKSMIKAGEVVKEKSILNSFKNAIDGFVYTIYTQRNMKIHLIITLMVIILSFMLEITKIEFILLLVTIALVIISEMINTAIETTIDMITTNFHPLAKIAKNVAAGAVFMAALTSVVVAYFIFFDRLILFIKSL